MKGAVGGQVDSDSEVPSAVVALHCEGIDDLMCFLMACRLLFVAVGNS